MIVTALITALAFYMMVSCIENYLYGTFTPLLRVLCGLTSVSVLRLLHHHLAPDLHPFGRGGYFGGFFNGFL